MPVGISAWTPLANLTLSSSQTSVTFSSISQSYRDLILVCDVLNSDSRGGQLWFNINSDSGSNYWGSFAQGTGSGQDSNFSFGTRLYPTSYNITTSTSRANVILHFIDYSNSTKQKGILGRTVNPAVGTAMSGSIWTSTAAITSISATIEWGFAAGSTFTLYGVSA